MSRVVPGYAVAAAFSVPPFAIMWWAFSRFGGSVTRMPQHWSLIGNADGYASPGQFFADMFLPCIGCAVLAILFAITFDRTVGRWAAAIGFGVLAAAGAAFLALWVYSLRSELGLPGSSWLIYAPLMWGALAFGVAAFARRQRPSD